MNKEFTASCDRVECGVAVLISDSDGEEYTVREPLSYCLCEGGVYLCRAYGNRIVTVTHLTELERKRREESLVRLSRLFEKNKQ